MYINCFKRKRGRPLINRPDNSTRNRPAHHTQNCNMLAVLKDRGLIDDNQYQAGLNFQVLYRRYLATIDAPHLYHTNWDAMGSKINCQQNLFSGSQPDSQSQYHNKIKETWFKVTNHLRSKLANNYTVVTRYILDDVPITRDVTRLSQTVIHVIQDGLNLLMG